MNTTTRAKPHIQFHDGFWWVHPWAGARWGVADPVRAEAWKRWRKHPWMRAVMAKGKP